MQEDHYHRKLMDWLDTKSVEYEHRIFENSCHSVREAAEASGEPMEAFVKNVCMVDAASGLIVAIVSGGDRASTSRVAKALGIDRPRLATAQEIVEKTGYVPGGVPSFSYPARFLIDPKVAEREYVLTGGGTEYALVKIRVEDIVALSGAEIVRVRK